ncbi:MAG: hypothetical protein KDK70_28145 [Myxococcales bacterium]|nr:hypothetical protein [Myxococcales bacterium]
MSAEDQDFVFNGIDGATGGYITPPMSAHQLVALARGKDPDEVQREATERHEAKKQDHYAVRADVDPTVLAQAGWGVIFAYDEDPAVREALQPLLELRRAQASTIAEHRYREFSGAKGYRPGERKPAFLRRQGAPVSGPIDPDKLPYYLMIVGSPERVPVEFQSQLGLQNAVGRLSFDTPDEYARYAQTVVACERGEIVLPRRMGLFGVKNDRATNLSAEGLIAGLERYVREQPSNPHAKEQLPLWALDVHTEAEATKDRLTQLLGGPQTPAVLFTASHGVGFPNGHRRQLPHQGALLCQDWQPAPGPIPQGAYFAADDLVDSANLAGLIAFLFACYGAGTPRHDAFSHRMGERAPIAPRSFLSALPGRMLSHPRGGALAAVGHVERAWGCSFYTPKVGHQIAVFESFVCQLLLGKPIGYAMECFGNRYGELSAGLVDKLEELKFGGEVSELEIACDWTANNDARNYVILGDPAVRVPVVDEGAARPRDGLELRTTGSDGGAEPDVSFGLFSRSKPTAGEDLPAGEGGGMLDALRGFVSKLGDKISAAIGDMGTLEVSTYVATHMSAVRIEGGKVSGAELRAYTAVALDGDTVVVVPERDGELDRSAFDLHTAMVQQAQQARTKLLETIVHAASSLVGFTK